MVMRRETPRIPKLRLDLLLYTNIGAGALAKYLKTSGIGRCTFDQPQVEHNGGSGEKTGDEAEDTRNEEKENRRMR